MSESMRVSSHPLPPPPDSAGNPRPPAAPSTVVRWDHGEPIRRHHDPQDRHTPAKYRIGPAGEPPLESVAARHAPFVRVAAVGGLVYTGFFLGVIWAAAAADDLEMPLAVWLAITSGLLILITVRNVVAWRPPPPIVAGARWVSTVGSTHSVDLYDLATIEVSVDNGENPTLCLLDRAGHTAYLEPSLVESHQDLWALIYHGIRSSTEAGADVDRLTRERLFLFVTAPEPGEQETDPDHE